MYGRGHLQVLFCLCIAPISSMLARESKGFESRHPITHLSFIDDIKIFEVSKKDLQLTTTSTLSKPAVLLSPNFVSQTLHSQFGCCILVCVLSLNSFGVWCTYLNVSCILLYVSCLSKICVSETDGLKTFQTF